MPEKINPTIAAEVEALLPIDRGITPRHAYARFGRDRSSPNAFRAVLLHLYREGRALRQGDGLDRTYRRANPGVSP